MTAPFLASVRDVVLVARFELVRALRTWQAPATLALYALASAGGARIFVSLLLEIEGVVATTMHVPEPVYAGTLAAEVVKNAEFRSMLGGMVGDAALVDSVLRYPLLAIFHLWFSIVAVPFVAAQTAAESVAVDVGNRAVRFELLRTGRLELVCGRFFGQAILAFVAVLFAAVATWTIGMLYMVGNSPLGLLFALWWLSLRSFAFALPFLGIGVACSQLTSSPAWARVLAMIAVVGTWIAYGLGLAFEQHGWFFASIVIVAMPQSWIRSLWEPGVAWVEASGVFLAMGIGLVGLGFLRFARRDL